MSRGLTYFLLFRTKYAVTVGAFIHFAKNNWNKVGLWGKYQIAKAALARQKPGFFASATERENFELAKDVVRLIFKCYIIL